jgi:Fic family protein
MLAGIGETLANPQLLIRPFLHREAVLSSRIEGTQASLSDLFAFEAAGERVTVPDAREVANYIGALDLGLSLLDQLPLCVRLTNQVHARLLQSVRGENRRPGELRTVQNYIGAPGTPIEDARYIPPPPLLVRDMLSDWEQFLNDDLGMPPLIQCALMHYQFEAIHPYVDGNGRVGRLLIILFLCQRRVLPKPLLYLSAYFERNRAAYYDHLYKVSFSSDWRSWLAFFLRGVAEQAHDAIARSRRVRELHERYRTVLQDRRGSTNVLRLLDDLFVNPYMTAPRAHEKLGVSREAARRIIERFVDAGILTYVAGAWPRIYVARELLGVIDAPVAAEL